MTNQQMKFNLNRGTWGGRRPGSGRKRFHSSGVAHRTRERVTRRTPLHINFKYQTQIRNKLCLRLLKRAIMNSRAQGLRVIHFSLQSNHIHLIVECDNNAILTKGMRSLTVTFAKGLKVGRVQVDRYHLHVLKTLKETKHAVWYVLFNKQKHEKGRYSVIDEYSSVFSLKNGLALIRKFAKEHQITIKIHGRECWNCDDPLSFMLRRVVSPSFISA